MTDEDRPLDSSLAKWLGGASNEWAAKFGGDRTERRKITCRITIGEFAIKRSGHQGLLQVLEGGQNGMVEALRQEMPATAWPISLELEVSRWGAVELDNIGVFNIDICEALGLKFRENWAAGAHRRWSPVEL